jgi:hypothetical protein
MTENHGGTVGTLRFRQQDHFGVTFFWLNGLWGG